MRKRRRGKRARVSKKKKKKDKKGLRYSKAKARFALNPGVNPARKDVEEQRGKKGQGRRDPQTRLRGLACLQAQTRSLSKPRAQLLYTTSPLCPLLFARCTKK